MRINYELEHAGWATVTLECGGQQVTMAASYLHDSLRDLARASHSLVEGAEEATVVFMSEPGEHHVVMRRGRQSSDRGVLV
jgi:hypothetical protein